jgi:hypothetical protein
VHAGWDVEIDDLPLGLVTHVVTEDGIADVSTLAAGVPVRSRAVADEPVLTVRRGTDDMTMTGMMDDVRSR